MDQVADWRGRFPFTIGAPSWVLPLETDNFVGNVTWLADKVDKVQILCFGKDYIDDLLNPVDLRRLAAIHRDTGLRFSLHLPADLALLDPADTPASRNPKIATLLHIFELTRELEVENAILHLDTPLGSDPPSASVATTLATLTARWPTAPQLVQVENTSWDLRLARAELTEAGFGVCADFGHLFHQGLSIPEFLAAFGPVIREVHLHGFNPGGDHLALGALGQLDSTTQTAIRQFMRSFTGSCTIENFRADWLQESLACLDDWIRSPLK